ncbi:MAG: DUF3226 domain-containing protein [Chloroflexales bacterium]
MSRMIVLVEGADDSAVVYHLLARYGLPIAERGRLSPGRILIEDGRGVDHILESLPTRLKTLSNEQPIPRLGLVLDADRDLTRRWEAIRNRLVDFGYGAVPDLPEAQGTVIQQDDLPIVGVWLMPDNQLPGELEDFVQLLVPATDTLWPRAEQAIEAIPADERRFPTHDLIKAMMHTWLAWQHEPGRPMGLAITKRFLDPDAPSAQLFIAWIRRLFPLEGA